MRSAEHKIIMGPRWHLHLSFKKLVPLIQSGLWLHTVGVTGDALLEKIVCTRLSALVPSSGRLGSKCFLFFAPGLVLSISRKKWLRETWGIRG